MEIVCGHGLWVSTHSILLGKVTLTQVDAVNVQRSQAFGTGLLAILTRAIDLVAFATLHEAELDSQEDVTSMTGTLEPAPDELS